MPKLLSREEIGPRAERLSVAEFQRLYAEHGALLFRGVATCPDDFVAISERFGAHWLTYQMASREMVSESQRLQTVTLGIRRIPPHSELCHLPLRPSTGWLYCDVLPKSGGATTLYDGLALAAQMPDDLRKLFLGKEFRYRQRMPLATGLRVYDAKDLDELLERIKGAGWQESLRVEGETLIQNYRTPALPIHEASGKPVFVNQLLHNAHFTWPAALVNQWLAGAKRSRSGKQAAEQVLRLLRRIGRMKTPRERGVTAYPTLGDGTIVPRQAIRKLSRFVALHEASVRWEQGDVLVFDNTRFMHGRQETSCRSRRILTRFGETRSCR